MKSNSMYDAHRKSGKCNPHDENPLKKVVLAAFLIGAGVLALLSNFNVLPLEVRHIIFSWQMLLIAIGIVMLFGRHKFRSGIILIVLGTAFLIPKIIDFPLNTNLVLWPAILIAIGFMVLFKGNNKIEESFKHEFSEESMNGNDFVNDNHIFGGGNYIVTSEKFQGGKITSIFGGGKYDFTRAKLAEGKSNVLTISVIFGGLEFIVPSDWDVKVEVDSIFGGFSNKRNEYSTANVDFTRQLIIRGSAVFGGGEIKRV